MSTQKKPLSPRTFVVAGIVIVVIFGIVLTIAVATRSLGATERTSIPGIGKSDALIVQDA